jgi:hypothetical protein
MGLLLVRIGLGGLGVAALMIGISIFLTGAEQTVRTCNALLSAFGVSNASTTALSAPNADSELRFYSALWVAFGLFALRTAKDLEANLSPAKLLLAIFFLGGIGRVLSGLFIGWPDTLFVILMWMELSLPPFLFCVLLMNERHSNL